MKDEMNPRRHFIKQVSATGAGIAASALFAHSAQADEKTVASANQGNSAQSVPFYGAHQAGITTPAQKHIYFLVVDLATDDVRKVQVIFQKWTGYAANLTQGKNTRAYSTNGYIPPTDTGEADDLNAHNLTLTFGVSPSFFEKLGIVHLKPKHLQNLPHFARDQLQEQYVGGDICIQACADDPQVAFHAVRNLVRAARGEITMKWSQAGFNSFEGQNTPRNLFAFKDGTANFSGEELDKVVWSNEGYGFEGGSYLVARRIKMFLETWDRTSLNEQENTFGRHRPTGAPMGKTHELDKVDLEARDAKGEKVIPETSHVHLAHKTGLNILRRSYSYASGIDAHGQFDSGLLFISFQHHPDNFIKIQQALGNIDKMNEYITHIGSGIFACFGGVKDENDYLGKGLFDAI